MTMRFPDDTHRHCIVGMTGTGKTTFALWCLAQRSYDQIPWIVVDFKRDPMIHKLPQKEIVRIDRTPPKHAGIYVVQPSPADIDEGLVTQFFWQIWAREGMPGKSRRGTGVYIDEGYMMKPTDRGLRAILTQGRSKRIPVMALSQRPTLISPMILSESEFKTIFYLQHERDIERVQEWLPRHDERGQRVDPWSLANHHSYWYGMIDREFCTMAPCPPEDEILDMFDRKRVRRRWF